MATVSPIKTPGPLFLGIEGGGTRTVAVLANGSGTRVKRLEVGPGNVKLLSDAQLVELFESIGAALPRPDAVAIGMAGARAEVDLRRIRDAAGKIWPGTSCYATDDLETALAAAEPSDAAAQVLVLTGTGSCCYGRSAKGKTAKTGGWGHVLGDGGSGYDIGLWALKAIVFDHDARCKWPPLGRRIMRRLRLREPNELIVWAQRAEKSRIAELAAEVLASAATGDKMASQILDQALENLARDAFVCAAKLATRHARVQFVFAGGVLLKQPEFARRLTRRLRTLWPNSEMVQLKRESAWGAVALAREHWRRNATRVTKASVRAVDGREPRVENKLQTGATLPPTERRHPLSTKLDKLPLSRAIKLMLAEDAKIPAAILAEQANIERALKHIIAAFQRGGRLFYVGAGTSGRLGVLDASECPPTFGTAPEMVQGIIAGGVTALTRAVEGAEDDREAGARAIELRGVSKRDVVVGISASGRAPFVWGALDEAARRKAVTVLLTFNPFKAGREHRRPQVVIAPQVGPEVLTGSTRLKAGTATKLILNIFTTLAMAKTGRVAGNLMARVNPSNKKLRERAVRIVTELCSVDARAAERALEQANWIVKDACGKLSGRRGR